MNALEILKKYTTIVADTGEIEAIRHWKPQDATTNPSLILAASQNPAYSHLIDTAVEQARKINSKEHRLEACITQLFVNFGLEILKIIPGRVSTEVDAKLSFDTAASVKKAEEYITAYEKAGIDRKRVLIKLAATWEGIEAARILEKKGIHCNMTLIFSLIQAIGCAEANATLISPFVGRILDWYKKHEGKESYPAAIDPGVISVKEIYTYFKHFGYHTQVMGASFRNTGEIIELVGCDLLTIAPPLLQELAVSTTPLEPKLSKENAARASVEKINPSEPVFRWLLNESAMATEKLAEGIRNFSKDTRKLESVIAPRLI